MNTREREQLVRILGEMNMGTLASNDLVLEDFTARLEGFFVAYNRRVQRFARRLPLALNLSDFLQEYNDNPHRVKVILQAVAFMCTSEMLAMMWMVLLGARIEALTYTYEQRRVSKLTVKIVLSDRVTQEHFESENHWDTAILRFAGISMADDAPVIESFHAIHIPRRTD
jgi:hypothetical protein